MADRLLGSSASTFDSPPDRHNGPAILFVDDEPLMALRLIEICRKAPELAELQFFKATTLEEVRTVLAQEPIQVMTLDKNLGENLEDGTSINGIDAIPEFLGLKPDLQIIMHTGSNEISDVVRAMQKGASDYITKNSDDSLIAIQIIKAIERAKTALIRTKMERSESMRTSKSAPIFDPKFQSEVMQDLLIDLEKVSESDRPVLLLGESGVGKTTMAKAIHDYRKQYLKQEERDFYAINLTALTPTLIESELFGHEKGAFTGATERRVGFIELANKGTLFIDEIGDIDLAMQAKLLTVLDKGTFHRVGSKQIIKSEFKLVCATNKDLDQLVLEGKFRKDFVARIRTFPINVPSLKDRIEDIPELVRSLLPQVSKEARFSVSYKDIPEDFIEALKTNPPRLNIRGLEIALHQLITLAKKDSKGTKRLDRWRSIPELKEYTVRRNLTPQSNVKTLLNAKNEYISEDFPGLPETLSKLEEIIVLEAKQKYGSNRRAAERLKISESSLSMKVKTIQLKGGRGMETST